LSYQNLIENLKIRHNKEMKDGLRPTIRKILNRDAAASRLMVLAVSQILPFPGAQVENTNTSDGEMITANQFKLELTDGWYAIQAAVDDRLIEFIQDGLIKAGTKLLISNAKLQGAEDGIEPLDESYHPSDPSYQIGLKICANSTRLAKWNAKLGFLDPNTSKTPHGLLLVKKVSDIIPGGGEIPITRLFVVRRYPLLYLEKSQKLSSSDCRRSPILSESEEERRQKEFEKRVLRAIEKLTESIQKEVEKVTFVARHPCFVCGGFQRLTVF
jgi:breast cancer 2 susceptibility protein